MKRTLSFILALIMTITMSVGCCDSAFAAAGKVKYCVHVQGSGWQKTVSNGTVAGTTGKAKRLEAIKIKVYGLKGNGIKYRTHIQNTGWQAWKTAGKLSGTTGKALRAEAIQIKLTGKYAKKYDVLYRVHVQNFGWLAWAKNGATAGTTGMAYRMEAIQIKLVKKGKAKTKGKAYIKPISVSYNAHVQNIGWQKTVSNGAVAGTTGQAKRLEAIRIYCNNPYGKGCIKYSAHVQNIGWQNWVSNGAIAGTTGQGKRLEAIKIQLDNTASPYFDVYYRVHVSNYGWLGWTKNGGVAGSTGMSLPIEAIQIRVVSNENKSIPISGDSYVTASEYSTANSKMNAFISDARWRNGAYWGPSTTPQIAVYDSKSCCAYCADFTKYCFDKDSPRNGAPFYNVNEIRAGDVITIGNQSDGYGHWFAVLGRNGNKLLVAEGNYPVNGVKQVRIGWNYTISGNKFAEDGRPFNTGYHFI